MLKNFLIAVSILFLTTMVWAQVNHESVPVKFMNSDQAIDKLKSSLVSLAQETKLPVIFPEQVPQPANSQHYYIYTEARGNDGYWISIDSTADCHGAHYCSVGNLTATKGENPKLYHSMDNQALTVLIPLASKKIGYFTPAHAMADYWPSQIEWREKNVLFRLSWNLSKESEKSVLTAMVNNHRKSTSFKGN